MQKPLSQNGCCPEQIFPHEPQFRTSFVSLTQAPLQQDRLDAPQALHPEPDPPDPEEEALLLGPAPLPADAVTLVTFEAHAATSPTMAAIPTGVAVTARPELGGSARSSERERRYVRTACCP